MKVAARFVLTAVVSIWATLPLPAKEFLDQAKVLSHAASATIVKYPDSDSVLIDDVIQVEYQADGTSETWDDTAIKILTEKGKRENRTLTLFFNTAYGTSEFTQVQVVKPNGTVHDIDIAEQSKVMVDPSQMGSNIYNPNAKVLKLSVPDLEIGDALRYIAHKLRTKTVVPNQWSDYQVFESDSPLERLTYRIIAPSERPLKKIALKAEIPGTVSFNKRNDQQNGHIVYTWNVKDVPRMFKEPNMPESYTVVQRLLVSTAETWEELSTWYWGLCRPHLEATTPEMKAKAKALTAGCTNTLGKIEAIFSFVSQDIRYMGITTEEEAPGYEPHDVKTTFENRYGVCRDKAALLAAMLRLVDVKAFPIIIMAGPKKDEEVPQPMFNHAVTAAIGDDGNYILMDSTDENTKDIFPSYLQNMSYLVARPDGETLRTSPIIPASDNLLKIDTVGTLDVSGKLTAQSSLTFEGINDTAYRGYFSKIKPEERRRFFEGHLKKTMPTAELRTFEILPAELRDTTEPLTIRLGFTADNLLVEGQRNKLLNLPRLGGSLGYANFLLGQTGLQKRKYPLYTRVTAGIRETLALQVPKDSGTPILPGYTQIDNPRMTWNMSLSDNGSMLRATNTFLLNTVEFSPQEYLALKDDLKEIEYDLRKKIIFDMPAAEPNVDADVRILNSSKDIMLTDASHWTETTHKRLKILTYSGTKKNSEIKIHFNPTWQQVELRSATVTQPDGSVKSIKPEEINIMDAGWVASAPRYPAEKILVANLPGVDIGSVLEYEIVSTVSGKPFFSTTQTFNGLDPIDRKTVSVTVPQSVPLTVRNTGVDETKRVSDGAIGYTWISTNQPAVPSEESTPAWWAFNPAVFLSTCDWKTYGNQVRKHLMNATEGQSETEHLAKQLTAGLPDNASKVVTLRDWVARNLRQAGPSLPNLPLSAITPADRTLKERYGNNADRMVVLYALLKTVQLKPEFVLSGHTSLVPEAVEPLLAIPARKAFDSVLIKVMIQGETIYLNGESQYAQLGTSAFNNHPVLDLASGKTNTLVVRPDKRNKKCTTIGMTVNARGRASITMSSIQQGTAFEGFHRSYAEITPENRRRHYLEMVSSISQSATAVSELVTDYSAYPGTLEFSVSADRYAVQDGTFLYFTLPAGLDGLLHYRSNKRDLPLAWKTYIDRTVVYNIALPSDYDPVLLPRDFLWEAPAGAGIIKVATAYNRDSHTVRIVQTASLKPAFIPADDFPDIIEASRRLAHPEARTILLRK